MGNSLRRAAGGTTSSSSSSSNDGERAQSTILLTNDTFLIEEGAERALLTRRDGAFAAYVRLLESMDGVYEQLIQPCVEYHDDVDGGGGGAAAVNNDNTVYGDNDLENGLQVVVVDNATDAAITEPLESAAVYDSAPGAEQSQMRRRGRQGTGGGVGDDEDDNEDPEFRDWDELDADAAATATASGADAGADTDADASADATAAWHGSVEAQPEPVWMWVKDVSLHDNFCLFELVQSIESSMLTHMTDELAIELRAQEQHENRHHASVADDRVGDGDGDAIRRRARIAVYTGYLDRYCIGMQYHALAAECVDRLLDVLTTTSAADPAATASELLPQEQLQNLQALITRTHQAKRDFLPTHFP